MLTQTNDFLPADNYDLLWAWVQAELAKQRAWLGGQIMKGTEAVGPLVAPESQTLTAVDHLLQLRESAAFKALRERLWNEGFSTDVRIEMLVDTTLDNLYAVLFKLLHRALSSADEPFCTAILQLHRTDD